MVHDDENHCAPHLEMQAFSSFLHYPLWFLCEGCGDWSMLHTNQTVFASADCLSNQTLCAFICWEGYLLISFIWTPDPKVAVREDRAQTGIRVSDLYINKFAIWFLCRHLITSSCVLLDIRHLYKILSQLAMNFAEPIQGTQEIMFKRTNLKS